MPALPKENARTLSNRFAIEEIRKATGFHSNMIRAVIIAYSHVLRATICSGRRVNIHRVGSFFPKFRKGRTRSPGFLKSTHGKARKIGTLQKDSIYVKFKAAPEVKEELSKLPVPDYLRPTPEQVARAARTFAKIKEIRKQQQPNAPENNNS